MSVTVGDLIYWLSESNATVTGLNGTPTTIIIPDTITVNGTVYNVTAIWNYAFNDCSSLASISIPNSVTTIGNYAFNNCSSLASVTFPTNNSFTTINQAAFENCTSLTSVIIPNSVTTIGNYAFNNCSSLASVTFNGDIPTIGTNNFTDNTNDTAYYYLGAQNVSRLSPTPAIFTNIFQIVAQPAPYIDGVTASNGCASISFTQNTTAGANDITSYEYSTDNGSNWFTAETITSPIEVTGLTNGTSYDFVLRNYYGLYSANSNIVSASVISTAQPAPYIDGVTASNGSASISFTQETTAGANDITSYEYTTDNGFTWVSAGTITSPIEVTSLTNGTSYDFALRNNNGLYSYASNIVNATVTSTEQPAPVIVGVTASNGNASISFTQDTTAGADSITSYEYSTNGGYDWFPAATITSPITVTDLTNGTSYDFVLRNNNGLDSANSNTVTQIVNTEQPAPVIVDVTASNGSASISFTQETTAGANYVTSYEYSTDNGSTWVYAATITSPITVTDLTNGTSYDFVLRNNNGLDSAPSNTVTETVTSTAQPAPVITSVTASNGSASISFTQNTTAGANSITSYEYSIDNGFTWVSAGTIITVTGLTNGTSYDFVLRNNNGLYSDNSNTVTETVISTEQPAPVIVGVTASNGSASISFTQSTIEQANPVTSYEYSIDNGSTWFSAATITSPIEVAGLINGTSYDFVLRNNNGLPSANSNTVTQIVNTEQPAPYITSVTASNGSASITFTQDITGANSITNYEYSTDGGSNWVTYNDGISTLISSEGRFLLITVTGLTNGTSYDFVLRNNNGLYSAPSNTVNVTVTSTEQPAPYIDGVISSNGSASITFTQDITGANYVTSYEYSTDNGSTWVYAATITSPITVTDLTNGTSYDFVLRNNNGLDSAPSNTVTETVTSTAQPAPVIVGVTASNGNASISFTQDTTAGADSITSFQYSTDNGFTWFTTGTIISPISVTGLTNGTSYDFVLRNNNGLDSAPSNNVTETVTSTAQPAPVIVGVTTSNENASISFTQDITGANSITSYEYSIDNGSTWFTAGTIITVTGLSNETTYNFVLRNNNGLYSADSNSVSATVSSTVTTKFVGTGELTNDIVNYSIRSDTTSVIISGYTSIGRSAFRYQPITSVSIGNTVTIIKYQAFERVNITSLTIPDNVITLEEDAFYAIFSLTSLTIGTGLTEIGKAAFQDAPLTSLIIPNNVINIGQNAFANHVLTSLTIGNGLKSIGDYAFFGTSNTALSTLVIPNNVTNIGVQCFNGCKIKNLTLSNQLVSIGTFAFINNNFKIIEISNTVTSIGENAFQNSGLSIVVISSTNNLGKPSPSTGVSFFGATVETVTVTPTIPSAPTITGVTVSSTQASIAFTAGSNTGSSITNYEYSVNSGSSWVSAGTTTSPISVTDLTNGTFYTFQIRAVNGMGAGAASNSVSAVVDVVPGAPTINSVTVSSGQASIVFTAGPNSGSSITNYEYSVNSGSSWVSAGTTTSPITVTDLTNGTTYVFRIIAVNAMGASTPSNAFSALVDVVPDAPTITLVNVSSGKASIVFTDGPNDGSSITDYEYSINGGSTWVSAGTITSPITVTGLTNGTIYVFSIRAVNTMGSGAASNIVSKLVRPTLPEAKAQNTLKADYIRYNYSLSDLVNSALYTIAELKLIGAVLGELKQFFTTETLITSWQFTGQELKREGLIDSGITFIYLVILFNNKFSINRAYGLNNENKEVTYYNVFNNGAYSSFVLEEIVQTDEANNGNEEISLQTTSWLLGSKPKQGDSGPQSDDVFVV